jgi:branched-chain amino acid transport system ATP-binding protein
MMSDAIALSATDLHVSYGPIKAVRGCSFFVKEGQSVAIIGANGAGKTTLLRALSRMHPIANGEVKIAGCDVRRETAHSIARKGLLHIPEGRGVLQTMSVRENLQISHEVRPTTVSFEEALERVFARFPRLRERLTQRAGNMSGGEQQMLALARAIINRPTMLLVDEPSLGLSPVLVREAYRALRELQAAGISILLVEQNVRIALRFADYVYVLRNGEIISEGPSEALSADSGLMKHYVGDMALSQQRGISHA